MYQLPPLRYELDALAPVIGAETMKKHHGKHHARYVQVTNDIVGAQSLPLEEVIVSAWQQGDTKLLNNAAQSWNHAFFWESMSPTQTSPSPVLAGAIDADFGSLAKLKQEFVSKGVAQFGSGWVWLIATGSKLSVQSSHDAAQPWLGSASVPILVCDVWEHAYYLDYQNERDRFLSTWFDRLANWAFAARQFDKGQPGYRYPLAQ